MQNVLNSRQIAADIEEKLVNQRGVLCGGIGRIIFQYQTNGTHATEPSTVEKKISEPHWKQINFPFQ